jgi:hypothetical protein
VLLSIRVFWDSKKLFAIPISRLSIYLSIYLNPVMIEVVESSYRLIPADRAEPS